MNHKASPLIFFFFFFVPYVLNFVFELISKQKKLCLFQMLGPSINNEWARLYSYASLIIHYLQAIFHFQ